MALDTAGRTLWWARMTLRASKIECLRGMRWPGSEIASFAWRLCWKSCLESNAWGLGKRCGSGTDTALGRGPTSIWTPGSAGSSLTWSFIASDSETAWSSGRRTGPNGWPSFGPAWPGAYRWCLWTIGRHRNSSTESLFRPKRGCSSIAMRCPSRSRHWNPSRSAPSTACPKAPASVRPRCPAAM